MKIAGFKNSLFAIVFLLLVSLPVFAQKPSPKAILLFQKGITLTKKNDFNGAIQAFEAATKSSPKFYDAFLALGMAKQQTQAFSEALSAYQSAALIRPKIAQPHLMSGALYQQLNDAINALTEYQSPLLKRR
jgi:tetratricopeptide (TPR) repeat protein